MKKVTLKVDASVGAQVRAGEDVKVGEVLGVDQQNGRKVFSPVDGVIEDCRFDAQRHEFVIVIKSENK
jgi:hypothetical protein